MTTPKRTAPLPIVNEFERIERDGKRAFIDTLRWLMRSARQRIDGDAVKSGERMVNAQRSRTER